MTTRSPAWRIASAAEASAIGEPAPFSVGSICSGIGGIELGLEAAGLGPTLWQIDINPYARAILAKRWPDAVRYEDLHDAAARPSELANVDIICGGTPCQDMSSLGGQAGIDGPKSRLWFDMLAIVEAKMPRFVVWENVLGSVRRGLERVVGGLCDIGYEVVGTRLCADDLGASHRRERVFVVGYIPAAGREALAVDRETAVELANANHKQRARHMAAVACGAPYGEATRLRRWPTEPAVGRVAHGVPHRSHRLAALGNSVTPPQAEVVGWLIRDIASGAVRVPR